MAVTQAPPSRTFGTNLDDQFLGNIYDAVVFRRLMGYVLAYNGGTEASFCQSSAYRGSGFSPPL